MSETGAIPIYFVLAQKLEGMPRISKNEFMAEFPHKNVTIQHLNLEIANSFVAVEPKQIQIKLTSGDGDMKYIYSFDQNGLDNAIQTYMADKSVQIMVQIDGKDWPTFPVPFLEDGYGEGFEPKCLVEIQIMKLSACIRRKQNWYDKMDNPEIVGKWTEEAKAQGCTDKQISYVLQELKYYASLRNPLTGIEVSDIDSVWQSDILIEESLKKELLAGVAILEDVEEAEKDFHPGTNNQVWDLVHPSLHPLVYGRSRVVKPPGFSLNDCLDHCGGGEIIPALLTSTSNFDPGYSTSTKFAWLPSEFLINRDGTVSIESYINNLHPKRHVELYNTLEKIFAKFVPLFENVINDQCIQRPNRISVDASWYEDEYFTGEEEDDDAYQRWKETRPLNQPIPPETFQFPQDNSRRLSLLGTRVQVIVKLANILLTPENPTYDGGVWHVEGMQNESIIASGIYYYDVENISESELAFRQNVKEPNYEQDDNRGVREVYGLNDMDPLNQVLGSVLTTNGRCIAFPNTYQHCVQPFQLIDPKKHGHRKILVFFLVNPCIPILSTLKVPPQQMDWYLEELCKVHPFNELLPEEITYYITKFLDCPYTLQKAKKLREDLMFERKFFVSANNEKCFQREFSLCEH